MTDWDPELYNRFRRYRAEPVSEILERLKLGDEESIVDLGCGSGENTVELARRTPHGKARGVDSSPAMIVAAEKVRATLSAALKERIAFELGDIRKFDAVRRYSVIFSNATLQWVPGHREIFRALLEALLPGGRVVAQMPANEIETAKVELNRLAAETPWAAELNGVDQSYGVVPPPQHYQQMLTELGFVEVNCYHRTFEHPMNNPGEIVQFYRSTGLRTFLDALPEQRHDEFLAELTRRYEHAYGTAGAVIFPFRRLFIWGARPR